MAEAAGERLATLDIIRGVAVMGILAMNIVAFAMPLQAYVNPLAYGSATAADRLSWAISFLLLDGRLRGLFSLLFGAGLLLVGERAEAEGRSATAVTLARLGWLLLFGLGHFYFLWYGDILAGYALVGLVAWQFRRFDPPTLLVWAALFLGIQLALTADLAVAAHRLAGEIAGGGASPDERSTWRALTSFVAVPSAGELRADLALHRGSWWALAHHRLTRETWQPLVLLSGHAAETLAFMLAGMAALKSGFLAGQWDRGRYRTVAVGGLAVALPAYAGLAALLVADGFSVPGLLAWSLAATVPLRLPTVLAYAALIILWTRRGGPLAERIAAAGRAALSNYLGTSMVMTALFYGWGAGLYGQLGRAELWLPVLLGWALMLAWSKPWLDRFRYGPLEWLWRCLARGEWQPLRRQQ